MPISTQGYGILIDYDGATLPPNKYSTVIPPIKLYISGEISDSKNASYESQPIIGRSTPLVGYNSTNERTISFSAVLAHDPFREKRTLRGRVRALKSYVYPDYTSSEFTNPPRRVRFRYGRDIAITGIITQLDIAWRTETMVSDQTEFFNQSIAEQQVVFEDFYRRSLYVTVNMAIQETREVDVLDFETVREFGDETIL